MSDLQRIADKSFVVGRRSAGPRGVARDHVEQVTDQLTRTVTMSADTRE